MVTPPQTSYIDLMVGIMQECISKGYVREESPVAYWYVMKHDKVRVCFRRRIPTIEGLRNSSPFSHDSSMNLLTISSMDIRQPQIIMRDDQKVKTLVESLQGVLNYYGGLPKYLTRQERAKLNDSIGPLLDMQSL